LASEVSDRINLVYIGINPVNSGINPVKYLGNTHKKERKERKKGKKGNGVSSFGFAFGG
jgi:hypothetical protein